MISSGLSLAILTSTGFFLIYRKLPRRVRNFMKKHSLFTDSLACLLTYALFGGTLVALFAAAFVGIITSILLALVSNPRMSAFLEEVIKKISKLKDEFINWATAKIPETKTKLKIVSE